MIKESNKIAIISGEDNITYNQLIQNVTSIAKFLPVADGGKCIIFSENRTEWIYTLFAVWQKRGIVVPVDATSTVSDLAYILNDCQPECLVTSAANLPTTQEAIKSSGVNTKVVSIEEYNSHYDSNVDTSAENYEPNLSAIALICYTSGTTGSPKGVMLSYENLFANIRAVSDEVPIFNASRRTMVLLPLHHILPLMGTAVAPILKGGGIAICPSLSAPDIMDTLCRGKIAIFVGVPRLWQTLYNGIKKKIDEKWITRQLFALCKKANNRTLSRLIFSSVRKKMGGHLDYCVSGGAALDREIGEGLRTLGLDVLEGYGMTETAPIIAFTRPGDIIPGCVGLPLPSVECKLVNGELCAKGPNVMVGYYKRPEETKAVIDNDGFIHTGDLARFDEAGRVYITGRSKEIIVLSNGKNVQPAEIEFQLEKYDTLVKEVAVTEKNDMLLAIIVPQNPSITEDELKTLVIQPYNKTVENYKKIMNIFIYNGDLPRTKLDKLQRFKLKDILDNNLNDTPDNNKQEEDVSVNVKKELRIIMDYIEAEKKVSVKPTDHIETDLAFDSLDRVSLQGFIEQTFGMTINADTMSDYKDLQALADKIAEGHTRLEVEKIDWHKILTNDNDNGNSQTSNHRSNLLACQSNKPQTLQLPTASCTHVLYEKIFKAFFKTYNRMTIKGAENIPATGPFILAPNHQSYLDAPIAMAGVPDEQINDIYFYATEEHVQGRFLRFMANRHNIILMENRNLKNSILKLSKVLRAGKSIMIFPEGTRTHTGNLGTFKKTFAILSKELNVPIVPVRITGAYRMLKRGSRFIQPRHVQVEYLPAVMPNSSLTYDEITQIVKSRIQGEA
ncbi:MAG: AMP-binding protein [Prevotella sp.]|nr:AMP-binding protein [Prevotella sp.]